MFIHIYYTLGYNQRCKTLRVFRAFKGFMVELHYQRQNRRRDRWFLAHRQWYRDIRPFWGEWCLNGDWFTVLKEKGRGSPLFEGMFFFGWWDVCSGVT